MSRVASIDPVGGGASSAAGPEGEDVADGSASSPAVPEGVRAGVVGIAEPDAVGVGEALGDCVGVGLPSSVGGGVG